MSQAIDIAGYMDARKFGAFNWKLMALSFLVMLIDGFDVTLAAFAVPHWISEWHVQPSAFGPVLGASLLGILFGSPLFGFLGDRYGRKIAIVLSYLTFGIATIMVAWSGSVTQVAVLRVIAGIGIGGVLPNIVALNMEFAPRRLAATAIILSFVGIAFGGALPAPVAIYLVPLYGWPILFIVGGGIPLIIGGFIALWLPESIRFLTLKDRQADVAKLVKLMDPDKSLPEATRFFIRGEEKHLPFKFLFSGSLAIMTPLLWFLFSLDMMVYFFLVSWMPTLLAGAKISLTKAAVATAIFQFGGVVGPVSVARPIDRFGMMPILLCFFLGVPIIGGIGYIGLQSNSQLFVLVFLAGFCTLGSQMGLNAITAILYPTALRSTGSGWAFGVGRVGSIIGPVVGGLIIGKFDVQHLYIFAAIPFIVAAGACFIMMRMFSARQRLVSTPQ